MSARLIALLAAALFVAGCLHQRENVNFIASGNPEKLSDWGLFTLADGRIAPHAGMVTYELNSPLFSDYAQKW